MTYKDRISEPLVTKLIDEKSQPLVTISDADIPFKLSWTHYLILMRIQDKDERDFYEEFAVRENWGKRELSRQYGSSLYERLLIGKDKQQIMKLARKERQIGFTFVARQKRFTFDEDHFRVDLVFYNRLLRCFVLIDLKTEKLKHQDLGQMQMYVNYFDRYEKTEIENPTIGILLCPQKNDAVVELTLPPNSNIYASQYQLYLPDKKLLQQKLQEWIEEETGGDEA